MDGNKDDNGNHRGFCRNFHGAVEDPQNEANKEGLANGAMASKRESADKPRHTNSKCFEARKPKFCFNWKQPGHIAAQCGKKTVFSYMSEGDENSKLLEPYTKELTVMAKSVGSFATRLQRWM